MNQLLCGLTCVCIKIEREREEEGRAGETRPAKEINFDLKTCLALAVQQNENVSLIALFRLFGATIRMTQTFVASIPLLFRFFFLFFFF